MARGKFRRRVIGPHSSNGSIAAVDRRTTIAKVLRRITDDLIDHVGTPSAPQRVIIQNAAFKTLRVTLFADRLLNDPNALSESSDHNLLAWSNSLRLDLVALGLEKREKPVLDLARYLTQDRAAETDATAPATADAA